MTAYFRLHERLIRRPNSGRIAVVSDIHNKEDLEEAKDIVERHHREYDYFLLLGTISCHAVEGSPQWKWLTAQCPIPVEYTEIGSWASRTIFSRKEGKAWQS